MKPFFEHRFLFLSFLQLPEQLYLGEHALVFAGVKKLQVKLHVALTVVNISHYLKLQTAYLLKYMIMMPVF